MKEICNCMYQCHGGCPEDTSCPFDKTQSSLEKDRFTSRNRHHSSMKEKSRSFQTAGILSSKLDKLPENASYEERVRLNRRVDNAFRKCQKFKRQLEEQE